MPGLSLDVEDMCTKAELVTFVSVPHTQARGSDVSLQYTLGSKVKATSQDWVGIFRSEWRRGSEPLAYQWAQKRKSGLRAVTFPAAVFNELGDLTETFLYMYVNKLGDTVGVSPRFKVAGEVKVDKVEGQVKPEVKPRKKKNKGKPIVVPVELPPLASSSDDEDWDFAATSARTDMSFTSDMSDIVVLSTSPSKEAALARQNAFSLLEDLDTSPCPSEGFVLTGDDDVIFRNDVIKNDPPCAFDDDLTMRASLGDVSFSMMGDDLSSVSNKSLSSKRKTKKNKKSKKDKEHKMSPVETKETEEKENKKISVPHVEKEQPTARVEDEVKVESHGVMDIVEKIEELNKGVAVVLTKAEKRRIKRQNIEVNETKVTPVVDLTSPVMKRRAPSKSIKDQLTIIHSDSGFESDFKCNLNVVGERPKKINKDKVSKCLIEVLPASEIESQSAKKDKTARATIDGSAMSDVLETSSNGFTTISKRSKKSKRNGDMKPTQSQGDNVKSGNKDTTTLPVSGCETRPDSYVEPEPEKATSEPKKEKSKRKNKKTEELKVPTVECQSQIKPRVAKRSAIKETEEALGKQMESVQKVTIVSLMSETVTLVSEDELPCKKRKLSKQSEKRQTKQMIAQDIAIEKTVAETVKSKVQPSKKEDRKEPKPTPSVEISTVLVKAKPTPSVGLSKVLIKKSSSNDQNKIECGPEKKTVKIFKTSDGVSKSDSNPVQPSKASIPTRPKGVRRFKKVEPSTPGSDLKAVRDKYLHKPSVASKKRRRAQKKQVFTFNLAALFGDEEGIYSDTSLGEEKVVGLTEPVVAIPKGMTASTLQDKSEEGFPCLPTKPLEPIAIPYVWGNNDDNEKDGDDGEDSTVEDDRLDSMDKDYFLGDLAEMMEFLPPPGRCSDGASLVDWQRSLVPCLAKGALPHFKAKYKAKKCHMYETKRLKSKKANLTSSVLLKMVNGASVTSQKKKATAKANTSSATEDFTQGPLTLEETKSVALKNATDDAKSIFTINDKQHGLKDICKFTMGTSDKVFNCVHKKTNKLQKSINMAKRKKFLAKARDLKARRANEEPSSRAGFDFSTASPISTVRDSAITSNDLFWPTPNFLKDHEDVVAKSKSILPGKLVMTPNTVVKEMPSTSAGVPAQVAILDDALTATLEDNYDLRNRLHELKNYVSNLRSRSASPNDNPKPAQARNPVDKLRLNHLKNQKLKTESEVKTLKSALRHKERSLASSQGAVHALQQALQEESKLVKRLQEKNEKTKRKYKKIKYAIVNETTTTKQDGITTLRSLGVPEWQEDLDLWGKLKNSASTQSNSTSASAEPRAQQLPGSSSHPRPTVYFHSQPIDGGRSPKETSGQVNAGFTDPHCQKKDQTQTRRSRDQGSCSKPSPFNISFRPTCQVDRSTLSTHNDTQTSPLNLSQNTYPPTHINWSKLADCPNTVIPVKYADDKQTVNEHIFSSPSQTQPRCTFSGQAPNVHSSEMFTRSQFPCADPSLIPQNYHACMSDPELAQLSSYPRNRAAIYNNLSDRNIAYCLPARTTGFRNNGQNIHTAPLGSPSDLRFNPNNQLSQARDCEDNLGLDNLWGYQTRDALFGNQNQQSDQQRMRGLGAGCHGNDASCHGNNTLNNSQAAYGSFVQNCDERFCQFGFTNSSFSSGPFKASGAFNKLN